MQMQILSEEEVFEVTDQQIDSDSEEEKPKTMRPPSISIMISAPSFQSKSCPGSACSIASDDTQSESPIKKGITRVIEWKNKVFSR